MKMIIFDLDGTLADCEHRRHFVDSSMPSPTKKEAQEFLKNGCKWKPNWKEFYEACDKDKPIEPTIEILDGIYQNTVRFWEDVQIWSGREESVRGKTIKWLEENILWDDMGSKITLKMRPIGDSIPDDVLKEKWLDEALAQSKKIDFVFDSDPKCIKMWNRRGVFVFNCAQHDGQF